MKKSQSMTFKDIAATIDAAESTVKSVYYTYIKQHRVEKLRRGGQRPIKIDTSMGKTICDLRNDGLSFINIANQITLQYGQKVSKNTIRNYMQKHNASSSSLPEFLPAIETNTCADENVQCSPYLYGISDINIGVQVGYEYWDIPAMSDFFC